MIPIESFLDNGRKLVLMFETQSRSYYERPKIIRSNFQKTMFWPYFLFETIIGLFELDKKFLWSLFVKGRNIIRLFDFSWKLNFIFFVFGLIFWPFEFFGLMVSAFCDFGLFKLRFSVMSLSRSYYEMPKIKRPNSKGQKAHKAKNLSEKWIRVHLRSRRILHPFFSHIFSFRQ